MSALVGKSKLNRDSEGQMFAGLLHRRSGITCSAGRGVTLLARRARMIMARRQQIMVRLTMRQALRREKLGELL